MIRMLALLSIAAACGHSSPAAGDGGTGDGSPGGDSSLACVPGTLFAAEPLVATAGDSVELEGIFTPTTTVSFANGVVVAPSMVGANRATVTVPSGATSGPFDACAGGPAPLAFQRTSFTPKLASFGVSYEQTSGGARPASLFKARDNFSAHVIGNYVYIVGGDEGSVTSSLQRATIHADGSLGAFEELASPMLTFARGAHTGTVIGNHLYIIGGSTGNATLDSVEVSDIAADGTLGPFKSTTITLTTPRANHTAVVIGAYLYVFGGSGGTSVERAPIAADGTLGSFAVATGTQLMAVRAGHTTEVIGDHVYVIGGGDANGYLTSIEAAAIQPDGTLGAFTAAGTLQTRRSGFASAVIGSSLYVFGGFSDAGPSPNPISSIEHADIGAGGALGAFATSTSALAVPRWEFAVLHIGNYLYAISGMSLSDTDAIGCERASIGADGTLATFSTIAGGLVTARAGHASVVAGDQLYVVGGSAGGVPTTAVDSAHLHADGSVGTFATVPGVTLATARAYFATARIWNYEYVFGGIDSTGAPLKSIERAPIDSTGTLATFAGYSVSSLLTARSRHAVLVTDNTVYLIGGKDSAGNALASIEQATINPGGSLGPFNAGTGITLATARSGAGVAVVGNTIFVVGGTDASGNVLNTIESATIYSDGSLGRFVTMTGVQLGAPRSGMVTAVVGGALYVIGGSSGPGSFASIERAAVQSNGRLGAFATVPGVSLSAARGDSSAANVGNFLYVLGGSAAGTATADVQQAQLQ